MPLDAPVNHHATNIAQHPQVSVFANACLMKSQATPDAENNRSMNCDVSWAKHTCF